MALLNPEQRDKLSHFIDVIRKSIPNNAIQTQFIEDLDKVYDPNGGIISINENKIEFIDDDGGLYLIFINSTSIIETHKNKDGNYSEKTEVVFNGSYTSVRKDTALCGKNTGLPANVQRRTDITDYKDNEVVHERKFFTSCNTSVDSSDSFTEESETYVSSSRIAYIREMTIDADGISNVTYHKCCSYNPKPFNDLDEPRQDKEPFIYESNENEYRTSIAEFTKTK